MYRGYIKIWRKIQDWEWYDNSLTLWFFINLVFMANWKDKEWHGIIIKRGQFVSSTHNLRFEHGLGKRKKRLTIMQVRTLISRLKSTNEITSQSTNQYTLYTIVKYNDYQDIETIVTNETTNETTNEQQTNNKRTTTTKELIRTKKKVNTIVPENPSYIIFEENLVKQWNELCLKNDSLSKIEAISESRRIALKNRYKSEKFKDFEKILTAIQEQPFLLGNNDRKWKVSFDWLISNDNNYLKVLEKKYKTEKKEDEYSKFREL